jgi:replicative DNA helicase
MNYGEMILSKVCDNNDAPALRRFGIEKEHFPTSIEQNVYSFIKEYAETNKGNAPDIRTVVGAYPSFTYFENVTDSLEYLSGELKNYAARIQIRNFLQQEAVPRFNGSDSEGLDYAKWVIDNLDSIIRSNDSRKTVGISMKSGTQAFLSEYDRRKKGESFRLWKSAFKTINDELGGYFSGNMYVYYGRSGRGKSVFTLRESVEAAFQGATVLIWAMEMSWFEVFVRMYSMVSAKLGKVIAKIDGIDMEAGFATKDLSMGNLPPQFEEGFRDFLENINDVIPGNIIVRSVDHEDFSKRDLDELERDIEETKADVVVVDPFYYLHYEKNTSRTVGGDAAATSSRLRALAGKTKTVIFAITQADEVKSEKKQEELKRSIQVPERAEVKKTKALLEDCSQLFAIDTADGLGAIEINKSRSSSSENIRVEVIYHPSYGIVTEPSAEVKRENQFNEIF